MRRACWPSAPAATISAACRIPAATAPARTAKHHEGQVWLQRQLAALVPATYFLVTFTLPAELRGLAWTYQRTVYPLLMQCAWE